MAPHGTPDWGLIGPRRVTYGLDDLGEHAVRVGAVPSWDRRGVVVFSDDFSEGLGAWYVMWVDPTIVLCLYTGDALSPPTCVKTRSGTAAGSYVRLRHYLGYEYRGRVGLECNVTIEIGTEFVIFGLAHSIITGENSYGVRLTPATGLLECYGVAPGWTAFGSVDIVWGNVWEWRNVKLVVDFDTGYYVKFVWMGQVIDMSGIANPPAAPGLTRWWRASIENSGPTGVPKTVYIDDVIVTIDEP